MNYDIFISYRRDGGYTTAKHLYDLLKRDGYAVSFDIDTLRSNDFDTQLYTRIEQCRDFILIVNKNAFDRTIKPDKNYKPENDWLRCELAYALEKEKNIIPIFLQGITNFPEGLPRDIRNVTSKNGAIYTQYHFDAFYKDLKKRFLISKPIKKIYKNVLFIFLFLLIAIIIGALVLHQHPKDIAPPPIFPIDTLNDTLSITDNDTLNDTLSITDNISSHLEDSRHMEFYGVPMNMDVDKFTDRLSELDYSIIEKGNKTYTLRDTDNEIIYVEYDEQNNNQVLGVIRPLEHNNSISDIIMALIEINGWTWCDFDDFDNEFGYINFGYGMIYVVEGNNGDIILQYVDSINTQGYKLWPYKYTLY